jgi:hypothetical protein
MDFEKYRHRFAGMNLSREEEDNFIADYQIVIEAAIDGRLTMSEEETHK